MLPEKVLVPPRDKNEVADDAVTMLKPPVPEIFPFNKTPVDPVINDISTVFRRFRAEEIVNEILGVLFKIALDPSHVSNVNASAAAGEIVNAPDAEFNTNSPTVAF